MSALSSILDSVTVYREGATCRRLAQVGASADRQVRLGGLPLSLEPSSLRARVRSGTGRVVDVRPQFDVELAEEVDVPAEQKALEASTTELARLEQQKARLAAEIAELQQLKPTFLEHKRGEPPRPAPIEAMLALGDFTEQELTPRLARLRELEQALADARQDVQLHQRRMQEASTAKRAERARLSRVAVVTLAEAPTAAFELELEYRVPGARWVPSYALTLARGMTSGTLRMRASVAQNTGEDWSQVKLSLSTASSQRRADMPELKALKIGRRQEAPARSGWREPPPGLDALFESYDESMRLLLPPPAPVTPRPAPKGEARELKKSLRMGEDSLSPPPPPPPAPRAVPMPVSMAYAPPPGAPPAAAPARAMASAPAMMAPQAAMPMAKKGGGGGPMRSRGAAPRAEAYEESDAPMDDAFAEEEGGMAQGFGGAPEPEAPSAALGGEFNDYARLSMAGADAPFGRGKLVRANEWDFAFVAGVSVQVDVVMAIVSRAQQDATRVLSLPLPAQAQAVRSVDSFDYRYDCAARLDVKSTGAWVLVPVTTCDVGLTPEYVCVPSVEPKVYRTLLIANRSRHALLPGPVDVTAGDEFLMTTTLPAIAPGAEHSHRLGLGVEEAIKVARKTQFKETTGGFLGGSTVLPHDVEIELNNRLGAPALIEVRERVPVVDPSEKDLKVEESAATPPWEKVEGPIDGSIVKGARRWRVTVPPGQSMKLTAVFAIRMPADKMLIGGNRRN